MRSCAASATAWRSSPLTFPSRSPTAHHPGTARRAGVGAAQARGAGSAIPASRAAGRRRREFCAAEPACWCTFGPRRGNSSTVRARLLYSLGWRFESSLPYQPLQYANLVRRYPVGGPDVLGEITRISAIRTLRSAFVRRGDLLARTRKGATEAPRRGRLYPPPLDPRPVAVRALPRPRIARTGVRRVGSGGWRAAARQPRMPPRIDRSCAVARRHGLGADRAPPVVPRPWRESRLRIFARGRDEASVGVDLGHLGQHRLLSSSLGRRSWSQAFGPRRTRVEHV